MNIYKSILQSKTSVEISISFQSNKLHVCSSAGVATHFPVVASNWIINAWHWIDFRLSRSTQKVSRFQVNWLLFVNLPFSSIYSADKHRPTNANSTTATFVWANTIFAVTLENQQRWTQTAIRILDSFAPATIFFWVAMITADRRR